MRPTSIIVKEPTEGPAISVGGGTYRILVSGAQSEDKYAVIDMLIPPNNGPGPHAHAAIQETFYVLEGEVVFRSASQTYTAKKGTYIQIPLGGAVHNFRNESDQVAHLLCTVVPAGMDQMFLEIGKSVAPGEFLETVPPTPEMLDKMRKIAENYGQELFAPDYFTKGQ